MLAPLLGVVLLSGLGFFFVRTLSPDAQSRAGVVWRWLIVAGWLWLTVRWWRVLPRLRWLMVVIIAIEAAEALSATSGAR